VTRELTRTQILGAISRIDEANISDLVSFATQNPLSPLFYCIKRQR